MFKNKKERLKTLIVIGLFGVIGVIAAAVVTSIYPVVGVIPAVSFTILYAAIALNFIIANSVVDNVKGYFLDRFCKSFSKKHPKANTLYDELLFEREKLNGLVKDYNNMPSNTLEQASLKDKQFAVLQGQKIKYNKKFKELSNLSQTEISAFNKYNNLNKGLMPIVIKKHSVTENAVIADKEMVAEKVATASIRKERNKVSENILEQEIVVKPIDASILSKLKDSEEVAVNKPVVEKGENKNLELNSAEQSKNK